VAEERERETFALVPTEGVAPEVGVWLAAMHECRQRTAVTLTGLPDGLLDVEPPDGGSTFGALLYHIAIVEADWLFDEILGTIDTDFPKHLFPVEMREDGTKLTGFSGDTLRQHLDRLKAIRTMLVDAVSPMRTEQLNELHERKNYDVSTAWVLHHLMQHEAEHRTQIGRVRELLGDRSGWWR
jgi:uncharacterized damage-inducible protein DinB